MGRILQLSNSLPDNKKIIIPTQTSPSESTNYSNLLKKLQSCLQESVSQERDGSLINRGFLLARRWEFTRDSLQSLDKKRREFYALQEQYYSVEISSASYSRSRRRVQQQTHTGSLLCRCESLQRRWRNYIEVRKSSRLTDTRSCVFVCVCGGLVGRGEDC